MLAVECLCFNLMRSELTCPDRFSEQEQQDLSIRLRDLGDIVFVNDGDEEPSPDSYFQEILVGPIVEKADGLRV